MSAPEKISDDVVLTIYGDGFSNAITGWKEVRVTRGIERMPGDFDISMTEVFPDPNQIICLPGMECTIDIGDDRVITGYIDRVINSIGPDSHQFQITGRGYCQDLVDCSAVWQGGQFKNQNVLQIAVALCEPYGISVICDNQADLGDPFYQICMTPGESPFAVISRLCHIRGLLCYEDENGGLNLSRVGSDGAGGGIQEGANVESASLVRSMDQRYSDYSVIQQGVAFLGDALGDQGLAIYTVKDVNVPRFRMKYIPVENNDANQKVALLRAQWEANRRVGRSYMLNAQVDSWRDLDGALWYPNTLVPLDIPTLKIANQTWLIGEISYTTGMNGKHCDMTIMPSHAFDVEPINGLPMDQDVAAALSAPGSPAGSGGKFIGKGASGSW